jgi:hypothetical protein
LVRLPSGASTHHTLYPGLKFCRFMTEAANPDPDHDLLARQIAILGELAEAGLRIALAVECEATADTETKASDCALAYGRVAKAIRLTLMLQADLIKALRQHDQNTTFRAQAARSERVRQQKSDLADIVERIVRREGLDAEQAERLRTEARERLDHEDLHGDILSRPLSELIAAICKDLGLEPDWPLAENSPSPQWGRVGMGCGREASG